MKFCCCDCLRDAVGQCLAFDELHDEESSIVDRLEFVERADVGVIERGEALCFVFESGEHIGRVCEVCSEDFYGEFAAQF